MVIFRCLVEFVMFRCLFEFVIFRCLVEFVIFRCLVEFVIRRWQSHMFKNMQSHELMEFMNSLSSWTRWVHCHLRITYHELMNSLSSWTHWVHCHLRITNSWTKWVHENACSWTWAYSEVSSSVCWCLLEFVICRYIEFVLWYVGVSDIHMSPWVRGDIQMSRQVCVDVFLSSWYVDILSL
jgi:hypothetical protein